MRAVILLLLSSVAVMINAADFKSEQSESISKPEQTRSANDLSPESLNALTEVWGNDPRVIEWESFGREADLGGICPWNSFSGVAPGKQMQVAQSESISKPEQTHSASDLSAESIQVLTEVWGKDPREIEHEIIGREADLGGVCPWNSFSGLALSTQLLVAQKNTSRKTK